jgi:hypothetical protein
LTRPGVANPSQPIARPLARSGGTTRPTAPGLSGASAGRPSALHDRVARRADHPGPARPLCAPTTYSPVGRPARVSNPCPRADSPRLAASSEARSNHARLFASSVASASAACTPASGRALARPPPRARGVVLGLRGTPGLARRHPRVRCLPCERSGGGPVYRRGPGVLATWSGASAVLVNGGRQSSGFRPACASPRMPGAGLSDGVDLGHPP